jgi:transposase
VIDAGSTQSISPDNCGILQADAYAGFGDLYREARKPIALTEALCWAHGRGNFFKLAQLAKAPLAIEAVRRTDAIFDLEHTIIGLPHEQRRATRQDKIAPLVTDLENWMRDVRRKMSRHTEVAKAIDYMLKRWASFSRFLDEGRICLTNNAAERALRGIALGRKAWLFAGSDRGGERAAAVYSLTVTAKLNDVDPRACSLTCWRTLPIVRLPASMSSLSMLWRMSAPDRSNTSTTSTMSGNIPSVLSA